MNKAVNHPLVCHVKSEAFDVYIGRPAGDSQEHYGNPFSHLPNTKASVIVGSRRESVQAFKDWLDGTAWITVEPERRQWILDHVHELRGKRLGCWCVPAGLCHGSPLAELANKKEE